MSAVRAWKALSIGLALLLCSCATQTATVTAPAIPAPPSDITTNVEFRSFLARGYPEQDMYIEASPGSPDVKRFEVAHTEDLNKMSKTFWQSIFTAAEPQSHDPFKVTSGGKTFSKGKKIGVALQLWGNGQGYGTYSVQDGTATLKSRFTDMMRNATYSLWCARVTETTFTEKPCDDALEPITTDRRGRLILNISFPAPPDSTTQTGSWLFLAYHSDDHQPAILNDFGKTTHAQVLFPIPTPAELRPAF